MYDWYNHSSDISNSGLIKQIEKQIAQGKINTAISLYEIYREHVLLFDQSNPKNVTDAVANYLIGNAYLEIEDDQLLPVIEQSCKDVSSNPARCAKAPYPCGEDTIRRIAFYARKQEGS